ncbi:beta-ketoacyl synthase N-terminal-like domain-containing protein, partial [Xanthomonas citri]
MRSAVSGNLNAAIAEIVVAYVEQRGNAAPGGIHEPVRILETHARDGEATAALLERLQPHAAHIAAYHLTDASDAVTSTVRAPYASFGHADTTPTDPYDLVIVHLEPDTGPDAMRAPCPWKAMLRRNGLLVLHGYHAGDGWSRRLAGEGFRDVFVAADDGNPVGEGVVVARSDGVVFTTPRRDGRRRDAVPSSGIAGGADAAFGPGGDTIEVRRVRIARAVLGALCKVLHLDADEVDLGAAFADYGLDSIVGVEFVDAINAALSLTLETTVIFDHSSVNQLTGHLLASIPEAGTSAAPASDSSIRSIPMPSSGDVTVVARKGPIAIVGMSGRFAHSHDLDALWRHLAAGDDLVETSSRWGDASVEKAAQGSFLDGIDEFDALFFNISGVEARYMDPKQRLFLQECWRALEDGGYAGTDIQEKLCGVYVGCELGDYTQLFDASAPAQAMWGNASSILASRIAYHLDLQGAAIAVDTACSSALVAVHLACQGLWNGELDLAIAGGVAIGCAPATYGGPGAAGMLSAGGRCYTFDDRADGFVPGEGIGAVLLRRLEDALRDGDVIHGVIRGSGINQDGATNGITAPSARSQERLHCQVYDTFGIDPDGIDMVEAHGTATRLGDPIEVGALTRAFRRHTARRGYCAIGSIKTNLGHALAASGIAGLFKVLLSMRHRQMPPSLHFRVCNPRIDLDDSPFFVNTSLRDWPVRTDAAGAARPRRAAVSAFGMSGTNAHLVIEEAPERQGSAVTRPAQLVVLSARSAAQLRAQAQRLLERLATWRAEGRAYALGDVSHTLLTGRRHFAHRLACVSEDLDALGRQLAGWLAGEAGAVRAGEIRERGLTERGPHSAEGESCLAACATLPVTDATAYRQRLERLAELFVQGEPLDYGRLFAGGGYARVPLPTYPFARSRYWVPSAPAPATEATVPTRSAGTDDGMDETHEAAPAFPLSGALTLVPGWAPIATGEVPVARARHDGTGWAILDDDPARQARWRARYPAAAVLTAAAVPARRAALAGIAQWFWMLPSAREPATGAAIVAGQAAGVMTGLALLQAFAAAASPLSLTVLTRRSQPVLAGEAIDPTHASVWGLLGSAAKEHPAWRLRLFDLEDEADEADAAPTSLEACLAWPADADGNGRAQRDGRWYRPVCVPCALPAASAPAFRTGGVYVIVGGAGELG